MSTDGNTPLFELDDKDDITYEDNPTVLKVRTNLVAAEWVQCHDLPILVNSHLASYLPSPYLPLLQDKCFAIWTDSQG